MADTRTYEYNLDGVKFTAELYIGQSGEVEAKVTMLEGHADFNTMYWGDDTFAGDSATVNNPNHEPIDLEAAGIKCQDVQFDYAQKMSAPGFEWEGTDKPTYLEAGETGYVTLAGETNLDNVDVLGFWGTNASTPDGEMNAVAGDGIADCGEESCGGGRDHDHDHDHDDHDDCDRDHHDDGKDCGGKDGHGKDNDDDKDCGGWGSRDRDDDHGGGKGGWGHDGGWGKGNDWGHSGGWGKGNDWGHSGGWGKACDTGKDWGKDWGWGKGNDDGHGKGDTADCGGSSKSFGWFKPLGSGFAGKFINLDPAKFYESCMTQKDPEEDQAQNNDDDDDNDHHGGHGDWHCFM
ncbi:hypothetical protein D2N39_13975 [Gemmobacter lutimaris]|uniref:Uncharacterized protein n=1 Tax=Gemmobacter lutimaris TaxID=2306023 RepID=A0A398BP93_9RHOB|nr:hypothetical protein [Gemmobacter lutimaris]RID91347.1 hypothetical protein D2N39_13975 [Gemmobacter lutimaris]